MVELIAFVFVHSIFSRTVTCCKFAADTFSLKIPHPIVIKSIFSIEIKFDNEMLDTLDELKSNGGVTRTSARSLRKFWEE
jgi:hypothetical protein